CGGARESEPHPDPPRAGAGAPRGDRPAPPALPGAAGSLRPGGGHPPAGSAAPGLAGRGGQEPAGAGGGTAPRPAPPPRRVPRRRGIAPNAGLLAARLRPDGPGSLVPPALLDSTTRTVVQLVAVRTIARTAAASLAQEVLRAMWITRWLKVAPVLVVAGATAS